MTPSLKRLLYGVGTLIGITVIASFVIVFEPYLGLTALVHQGFYIESPDVFVQGADQTIRWSASPTNATMYPKEKIEVCRTPVFADQCVTIADRVPNSRSAKVRIPATLAPGAAYLRMTAVSPEGQLLINRSSIRPITIVRASTFRSGQRVQVSWKADTSKPTVKIEFCTPPNPTSKCVTLGAKVKNTGTATLTIPPRIPETRGYVIVRNRTVLGTLFSGAPQFGTSRIISQPAVPQLSSEDNGGGGSGGGGSGSSGDSGSGEAGGDSTLPEENTALCQGVNLKDFGAKGDGKTDDTTAFQHAFAGTGGTLCIPAGHYIVSSEFSITKYATLRSDGRALIEQKCGNCNIFVFSNQPTVTIRGLKMLGGRRQIVFSNGTGRDSQLNILNADLEGSSDYAIYTGTSDGAMSGTLRIERGKIIKTRKVLRNTFSSATVQDTWVHVARSNFDENSAAFWNANGATLTFDNMTGVPSMGEESNHLSHSRWVDNYGSFRAVQTRFGGEDAGMPVVYQFGGGSDKTSVVIQDSQISAGSASSDDSAVIVLKDNVPRSITLSGNFYLIATPLIRAQDFSVSDYLTSKGDGFTIRLDANLAFPTIPDISSELERFTQRKRNL